MTPEPGQYIVADPNVCHGEPTFRGTRVLVADLLEQAAMGLDWQTIAEEWRGHIDRRAISEAVRVAADALLQREEKRNPS